MELALEVKDLRKTYKQSSFELKSVNIKLPKGCIMGFVGKNGAGKTTTIKAILDVIQKDSGTIKVFGEDVENIAVKENIAVVFDGISFMSDLTPNKLQNVLSDIYSNWNEATYKKLLEKLDIPPTQKIKTLSRGMMMKLSIVIALSHNAKLLILDEPTAGLDPVVREEVLDLLLEFMQDEDNSILMSSHISSDLEKIADYIMFIDDGQIIMCEEKDKLIYEFGIARMKQADFEKIDNYVASRKRGLQIEVLIDNKKQFCKQYPDIIVDNVTIDEMLPLLTKGVAM
ncbi:MAG: ABC transporter [Epulopiscium sp. Nele67-Bin004]|nr:MAG: ABC transporter [Epulopiscium sp. Nele67-Bin004]